LPGIAIQTLEFDAGMPPVKKFAPGQESAWNFALWQGSGLEKRPSSTGPIPGTGEMQAPRHAPGIVTIVTSWQWAGAKRKRKQTLHASCMVGTALITSRGQPYQIDWSCYLSHAY
jgi:hypothetical protein